MSLRNKRYTPYDTSTVGQLVRNKIFKTNNENKKKILTDVRNSIDELYSSYTKNNNINNKKVNTLENNLRKSLKENKQLQSVVSKYQQYSKKLENGYTALQLKHQQQQQRKQQQKQVKFVDSDYGEDNDLQDLEVQAGPNEKKDQKLLAQRYPKYHYQNRNRNGKLTILKKPKQQKVYKKQQLTHQLEEQHTEDEDKFGDNDNELNQFLE